MIQRAVMAGLLLCCAAAAQEAACLAVQNDRITAADFAAALPAFAAVAAGTPIGSTAMPGVRRVFHISEVAGIAKRYGVDPAAARDLCFEWPTEPLDQHKVLIAMQGALAMDGARIEIIELSRFPAPPGRLEFSRDKLTGPALSSSVGPVIWRGEVIYGGTHRFAVWARVNITVLNHLVIAAENLKPGEEISASMLKAATSESFPRTVRFAQSIQQVVGLVPRRPISAGTEIRLDYLDLAPDIRRGNLIDVEVRSGAARLGFTAKAESAGRSGDLIPVRNLSSNKIFQARVCGKDKALVVARQAQVN